MREHRLPIRGMTYAALFGALTAVGAYIAIPVPPVPITMQTFFVSLAGGLLGGPLGAMSQAVYLLLGVIGLPVFAGGKAGFGVLLGPTGGYLFGFIFGAYMTGRLLAGTTAPGFLRIALAMLVGYIFIYVPGILQLMYVAKLDLPRALAVGLVPTIPGGALKIVLAAWMVKKLNPYISI